MEVVKFGLETITEPVVNEFSPAVYQERSNSKGPKKLNVVYSIVLLFQELTLSKG